MIDLDRMEAQLAAALTEEQQFSGSSFHSSSANGFTVMMRRLRP